MTIVGFGVGSSSSSSIVGATFSPVSLATVNFTAGNWGGDTPGNLSAIADSDSNSATTWGRTYGSGNKGWIQADLGQNLNRLYLEIKLGVRMNTNWPSGEATWAIEVSPNTNFFMPLWQAVRIKPTTSEQILQVSTWGNFRYLRVTTEDTGAGQAELRWYDLRIWQLSL